MHRNPNLQCYSDQRDDLALCQVVVVEPGAAPPWIQLIPAGDRITALDGRKFGNPNPQSIVDAFNADPRDLPVDYEHSTEIRAPMGQDAPAAGWIVAMEVRDGAVWGQVEWNDIGRASLEKREYRYISPAFMFDKETGDVLQVVSAALVNRPALDMPAVARANKPAAAAARQEDEMDPKLLEILGLDDKATPEQILEAVKGLRVAPEEKLAEVTAELEQTRAKLAETETALANARSAQPKLDEYVPRADYDAAVSKAKAAEDKVAAADKAAHDTAVETAIAAALQEGKITPATKDYYVKQCADAEGLAAFNEFVKGAPVIGEQTDLDDKKPPNADDKMTDEERAVCKQMGLSEEAYLAAKKDDDEYFQPKAD